MNERILAGRYRLQDAVGGKPDLYHALDEALSRQVTVKRVAGSVTENNRHVWEQEIAKAAGLHHPHLLAVYDVVIEEDSTYLITEDLEGDTLARWTRDRSPLAPEQAVSLICQLAGAVVQAEKHGLHDLSIEPKGVLVAGGYVKVIEYGPLLEKRRAQSTREQLQTVGVLLYELLTGQTYSELAPTRQVVQDVHHALNGVTVHHSWLPERMERIVHRALGILAEGGYATMQELFKDVKAVQHALNQQADVQDAPLGSRSTNPAHVDGATKKFEQMKESVLGAAQDGLTKVAQVRQIEFVKQMTEKQSKQSQKRSPLMYALGVLVLVLVCGGLWWTVGGSETAATVSEGQFQNGKEVKMPSLVNKTEEQALQILTENGFPQNRIQWVYKPMDEGVSKGKVYQQSVDPNTQVNTAEQMIVLTINGTMGGTANGGNGGSGGGNGGNAGTTPHQTQPTNEGEVPDLKGLTQQDAEQLLLKTGYRYGFEIMQGDTASGTVFKQEPAAGSKLEKGGRVTFSVSQ